MAIRNASNKKPFDEVDPETDEGEDIAAGAEVAPEVVQAGEEHPLLTEARNRAAGRAAEPMIPAGERPDEATIIELMTDEQRDDYLVMTDEQRQAWLAGEERIWVEALKDGTYAELDDPRFEPWDQRFRHGRFLNTETNETLPGDRFRMRRRDVESILRAPRSHQWVKILAKGEIPRPRKLERQVPTTTAPRGYGQGRRIGRILG